jgi:hypothetical protein
MSEKQLTFQELPALRRKTEAISQYLQHRLNSYLETLKSLLAPERVFGKYVGGKFDNSQGDKAAAQISQTYKELVGKPLDLPREFEAEWLANCGSRIELHRHEYIHHAGADRGKAIRIASPVRWIMTCGPSLSPLQVFQAVAGNESAPRDAMRQFAVNALAMQVVFTRSPGLVELFHDLRFELRTESFPETGKLPFLTITSLIPSFRPDDDLILAATEFSGVAAFIELIDPEAIGTVQDPLKAAIDALAK